MTYFLESFCGTNTTNCNPANSNAEVNLTFILGNDDNGNARNFTFSRSNYISGKNNEILIYNSS